MIQRAFGSSEGVSAVYNRMEQVLAGKSLNTDLQTIKTAVSDGTVKHYGKPIDVAQDVRNVIAQFSRKIVDDAKRRFGERVSAIDGIFCRGWWRRERGEETQLPFRTLLPPEFRQRSHREDHQCLAIKFAETLSDRRDRPRSTLITR